PGHRRQGEDRPGQPHHVVRRDPAGPATRRGIHAGPGCDRTERGESTVIDPQDVTAAQRSLGAQLARLREAAGHTQTEFAAKVYISRSSVANIETGHSRGTRDFW